MSETVMYCNNANCPFFESGCTRKHVMLDASGHCAHFSSEYLEMMMVRAEAALDGLEQLGDVACVELECVHNSLGRCGLEHTAIGNGGVCKNYECESESQD